MSRSNHSGISAFLVLGLTAFAILYLAAHVAAALFGWRVAAYGGAALGVWIILTFLVVCFVAAGTRRP